MTLNYPTALLKRASNTGVLLRDLQKKIVIVVSLLLTLNIFHPLF